MACTLAAPCGGRLAEDLTFRREAELEGVDVRRYACLNGHEFFDPQSLDRRGWTPTLRGGCVYCHRPIDEVTAGGRARPAHTLCARAAGRANRLAFLELISAQNRQQEPARRSAKGDASRG